MSPISVFPKVLDFGKVRPTDSPVKLTFDIVNNSNRNVVIADILSGCSCADIDVPKEPIPPQGKIAVGISINVWGRSGTFEDYVTVKTASGLTAAGSIVQVSVLGTVETDIWTNGQALRCTFDSDTQSATTVLTVYTVKYPDIVFAETSQDDRITVKEISRDTRNGETAIRFSVEVNIEPNSTMMRTISLVPENTSIAPLNVPLYGLRVL